MPPLCPPHLQHKCSHSYHTIKGSSIYLSLPLPNSRSSSLHQSHLQAQGASESESGKAGGWASRLLSAGSWPSGHGLPLACPPNPVIASLQPLCWFCLISTPLKTGAQGSVLGPFLFSVLHSLSDSMRPHSLNTLCVMTPRFKFPSRALSSNPDLPIQQLPTHIATRSSTGISRSTV